jgi:hypothetical protein
MDNRAQHAQLIRQVLADIRAGRPVNTSGDVQAALEAAAQSLSTTQPSGQVGGGGPLGNAPPVRSGQEGTVHAPDGTTTPSAPDQDRAETKHGSRQPK